MTINDPVAFVSTLWDWAILDGCFGTTRIKPTDIDGFVERHGYFMVIETKRPGVAIPYGQHLTFEALRKLNKFWIFIVWGYPGKPEKIQLYSPKGITSVMDCDVAFLRHAVTMWFEYVEWLAK